MALEDDRQGLKQILQEVSVRRGEEFTLASGRRSNVYVDARLTTLRAAAMPLIGRLFLDQIRRLGWKPSAVGGLTMGADPLATAVAYTSVGTDLEMDAFIVRKEIKRHGMQRRIEGLGQRKGIDAVVVEDVATTGGSTAKAVVACQDEGLNVLGAIALVDREEGAEQHLVKEVECPFYRIFRLSEL